MSDEEVFVAKIAAAFRRVLEDEPRRSADDEANDPQREGRAVAAAAAAALGDPPAPLTRGDRAEH